MTRSTKIRPGLARRAHLALADGRSCEAITAKWGASPTTISRWNQRFQERGVKGLVWARAGVKPHRLERYMESPDPLFEEKAAAIIGLYLTPPENAAVFCVDEKTCIQALDRCDPCCH